MASIQSSTTLGVFSERQSADGALAKLSELGYNVRDISIVVRDTEELHQMHNTGGSTIVDGAVSGATTGGVIGGIAGLLVGIGAIVIPGIGGLLIGGPLAAALGLTGAAAVTVSGVATGAVAGGFVGSLVSLGLPEDTAVFYEQRVREGAILLAVPTINDIADDQVREVFKEYGADQIRTIDYM